MKPILIALLLFGTILVSGCSSNATEDLDIHTEHINQVKADEVAKNNKVNPSEEPIDTYDYREKSEYAKPRIDYDYSDNLDNGYEINNQGSCCKICSKGKACGDSCISRSYECHKGV